MRSYHMTEAAIDKAAGLIGEAERLLHAAAKLIDGLGISKEDAEPLIGVTYAALEKIEAAGGLLSKGAAEKRGLSENPRITLAEAGIGKNLAKQARLTGVTRGALSKSQAGPGRKEKTQARRLKASAILRQAREGAWPSF